MNRMLAAFSALLISGSAAAQIFLVPAQPRVGDPVTVEFTTPASIPCPAATNSSPFIGFDGTGPQGTGTVIYVEVANAPCGSPPLQTYTGRVSLGRLPVGPYTVRVRQASTDLSPPPPPFATLAFNVVPTPAKFIDDDLSGHWLTDNAGEGVTIVQSQNKVFIVFVTYDSSGRQRWFVAPDAKFDESGLSDDAPPRIFGSAYETSGFPSGPTPPGPATGNIAYAGFVSITLPTAAHDRASMVFYTNAGVYRLVPLRRFLF